MTGPMAGTARTEEGQADAVNLQALTVDRIIASQGADMFQFQPIPPDTPRLQVNEIERQRQEAIQQLLGFIAQGDQASFTARGNELGLTNSSAAWSAAQESYLNEAWNTGRQEGLEAMQQGDGARASEARQFAAQIVGRIVELQPPEAQAETAERYTRQDYEYYQSACTDDQCRQDLLNAMAGEGYNTSTIADILNELTAQDQNEGGRPVAQLQLGGGMAAQQPMIDAIQRFMRQQLRNLHEMQDQGRQDEEIRRSEAYRRLVASVGSAQRADRMITKSRTGNMDDYTLTESTSIMASSLMRHGYLKITPSKLA